MKRKVVISLLGTVLDKRGKKSNRWQKWRPNVGLCMQPDFAVDTLILLHQPHSKIMAEQVREDIGLVCATTDVQLSEIELIDPWDFEEVYSVFYDFALKFAFDNTDNEYFIHITTGTHVAQICWFLLTEARYFPAQLIQTAPNHYRLHNKDNSRNRTNNSEDENNEDKKNPAGVYSLIDLDLSRYTKLTNRFDKQQQAQVSFLKAGIATRNEQFNKLITKIERVALCSNEPLLLTGPTGAGKSLLAKRIYQLRHSRYRVAGHFVEVNCATLRGDNAMSTLFGHVKGAFTGALSARSGLLREADGGILFLDEIAELGADEQAMLLKAIEEKCFYPYGSDSTVNSDFLLITGTHRNLRERVDHGLFREDLYERINMWTFRLPSLVERPEDIEPNIDYEVVRFSQTQQTQIRFDKEARARYLNFACSSQALWRGNFRELSASIKRMATFAEQGRINLDLVEEEITHLLAQWHDSDKSKTPKMPLPANIGEIDLFDKAQLAAVITLCQQHKSLSEAGRELFAISRQQKKNPNDADRLRKYLARFQLDWQTVQQVN